MNNWIFVTGGAGYIGSNICAKLKENPNNKILLIDKKGIMFPHATQYCDTFADEDFSSKLISDCLIRYRPATVIHCAEDIVDNSLMNPDLVWENNFIKNQKFFTQCAKSGVNNFLFFSSDSVYGEKEAELQEIEKLSPNSCYAKNKISSEFLLNDLYISHGMKSITFRTGNVCGVNTQYELGILPPNNSIQYKIFNAITRSNIFEIFGSDYETADGTIIRDYIHIDDVVSATLLSLEWIYENTGSYIWNLGSGTPVSILDLKNAIESQLSTHLNIEYCGRLPGKPAKRILDCSLIKKSLPSWTCKKDLHDIISSSFRWHSGQLLNSFIST